MQLLDENKFDIKVEKCEKKTRAAIRSAYIIVI